MLFKNEKILDSRNNYPTCGNSVQDEIEYNKEREQLRLEELRLKQEKTEEIQRKYERDLELQIIKDKETDYEKESEKDLILLKQMSTKKKTSRLSVKREKKSSSGFKHAKRCLTIVAFSSSFNFLRASSFSKL